MLNSLRKLRLYCIKIKIPYFKIRIFIKISTISYNIKYFNRDIIRSKIDSTIILYIFFKINTIKLLYNLNEKVEYFVLKCNSIC